MRGFTWPLYSCGLGPLDSGSRPERRGRVAAWPAFFRGIVHAGWRVAGDSSLRSRMTGGRGCAGIEVGSHASPMRAGIFCVRDLWPGDGGILR